MIDARQRVYVRIVQNKASYEPSRAPDMHQILITWHNLCKSDCWSIKYVKVIGYLKMYPVDFHAVKKSTSPLVKINWSSVGLYPSTQIIIIPNRYLKWVIS